MFLERDDFLAALKDRPVLGIDLSPSVMGLALWVPVVGVISPLPPIRRTRPAGDARALSAILKDHAVHHIALGWPLNMDGTPGPRCQSVQDTAMHLHALLAQGGMTPVWTRVDERLSTAMADNYLDSFGDKSASRRERVIDSTAACVILDRLANGEG